MEPKPTLMRCFTCNGQFQFGPDRYDGVRISDYEMMVCGICYGANWDGWGPSYEPRILKHLNERGIPEPRRNSKGWLPRDG
jgi:hypothetical protein